MKIQISDSTMRQAADQGVDAYFHVIVDAISRAAGGELNAQALQMLTAEQITLWGYAILHEELMDGGFVQLIHNGYGPFFFDNPFAKAMRLWGLPNFSKLLYKGKALYEERKEQLTRECTDEEFMALFEKNPEFDELDDTFVENEEQITARIVYYVDEHLDHFVEITQD